MARTHWSEAEELMLLSTVVTIGEHAINKDDFNRLINALSEVTGRSRAAVIRKANRMVFGHDADDRLRDRKNNKPNWQKATKVRALRNGFPWEEWEDELIMTSGDVPLKNLAYMIGRTYRAVEDRRKRLRKMDLTWC